LQLGKDIYTMDPGSPDSGGKDVPPYDVMKNNFDATYAGNRSPLPFFTHIFWFTPARIASAQQFFAYANSKPDVYFVTPGQLLAWMKNPLPKEETGAWLKTLCGSDGGLADSTVVPPPAVPVPGPAFAPEPAPALAPKPAAPKPAPKPAAPKPAPKPKAPSPASVVGGTPPATAPSSGAGRMGGVAALLAAAAATLLV
jgi:hypothetical protein